MKIISTLAVAAPLLLLIILTWYAVGYADSAAQGPTTLGADMDSAGNTSTSLGSIESCVSVGVGETFNLDVFVSDVDVVDSLVAWEFNVAFDPSVVEVIGTDEELFLAANPGSGLITLSVPLSGGRHFLGAADMRGAPESGSGVLAQLTLRAKAAGVSLISIPQIDVDDNGSIDMGPRLTNAGSGFVGDVNGDSFFDGPIISGAIAVDQNCSAVEVPVTPTPPTPTPPPDSEATPESPPPAESTPTDSAPSREATSSLELVALPTEITDFLPADSAPSSDASPPLAFAAVPAEITDSIPPAAAEEGEAGEGEAPGTAEAGEAPPDQAGADSAPTPDSPLLPQSQQGDSSSDTGFPLWLIIPILLGALAVPLLAIWWLRA